MRDRTLASAILLLLCGCGDGSTEPDPDPPQPSVASVAVTPAGFSLASLGQTEELTAVAQDASGVPVPGKTTFAWASSDPGVATVDNSGVVTAVSNGTATVSATIDGQTGDADAEVAQVAVALVFTTGPVDGPAGDPIAPAVEVALQDAMGSVAVNSSDLVAVEIGTNPAGASLSGDTEVAAVSGVATFDDLMIDIAAPGYTLLASSGTLVAVSSSSVSICLPPSSALLWLPFDEIIGGVAPDISGSGRVGRLSGGAAITPDGFVGGALDLTSHNGEVRVSGHDDLRYQDWEILSVEFWLRWSGEFLSVPQRQYIWDSHSSDAFPGAHVLIDTPGIDEERFRGPGVKCAGSPNTAVSLGSTYALAPAASVTSFDHFACVFDKVNGEIKIFKNGELVETVDWTPSTLSAEPELRVGNVNPARQGSFEYHFFGLIDELSVRDTDLSSQIPGIYTASSAGRCKP